MLGRSSEIQSLNRLKCIGMLSRLSHEKVSYEAISIQREYPKADGHSEESE